VKDTSAEVEDRFNKLLRHVTPEQRLAMSGRMFAAARELVRAGIVQAGAATDAEIRRQIFLRFYGDEFAGPERAKILSRLGAGG